MERRSPNRHNVGQASCRSLTEDVPPQRSQRTQSGANKFLFGVPRFVRCSASWPRPSAFWIQPAFVYFECFAVASQGQGRVAQLYAVFGFVHSPCQVQLDTHRNGNNSLSPSKRGEGWGEGFVSRYAPPCPMRIPAIDTCRRSATMICMACSSIG